MSNKYSICKSYLAYAISIPVELFWGHKKPIRPTIESRSIVIFSGSNKG